MGGIPGLVGTEHIGFTVPDLDEAERFFVDVIGCERLFSLGPFASDDSWMADHLNVDPRTVMRENRFLRCRTGPNFEIFRYETPEPPAPQPRNSDIGGHHLAQRQADHVTGHEVGHAALGEPAVTADQSVMLHLGMQFRGGLFGPVLIGEAQTDTRQQDDPDDDGLCGVAEEERQYRGAGKQEQHGIT